MDSSAAFSYVYAKASGMLAKSFSDRNAQKLFDAKSLSELWSIIFPNEEVPSVPESLLAKQIETHAQERFIRDYARLVECFEKPDEILIWLLRSFDIENLKTITASLVYNEQKPPETVNIGEYSLLNVKEWPNLQKITENSEFSWYNKAPDSAEIRVFESKIDKFYAKKMFSCVKKVSGEGKDVMRSLIFEEYSLRNILWALRLKVYYKMETEEILPLLAYSTDDESTGDVFVTAAIDALERDIEKYEDWRHWKYSDCLNPNENGEIWRIDPAWLERKVTFKFREKVRKCFHRYLSATAALYSWFKIKQTEVDYIRKAAEGLKLGLEGGKNV